MNKSGQNNFINYFIFNIYLKLLLQFEAVDYKQ